MRPAAEPEAREADLALADQLEAFAIAAAQAAARLRFLSARTVAAEAQLDALLAQWRHQRNQS